ncbi:MAG TPA: hypothetical protein VE991_12705, partial [Acidimicrobiales bacterium]|nr:hypothetical protein [Acidimicrobiales bacterium]
LGDAHGRHLAALARGEDSRAVEPDRAVKSVGHEETFASDLHSHEALHGHLVRMADAVANRLVEAGRQGRTVTVKIRFGDRTTITRAHSLPDPTSSGHDIRTVAAGLLRGVDVGPGVRLLGVSVSGLHAGGEARQLTFAEVEDPATPEPHRPPEWDQVETAVAAVRARYGDGAVAPAVLAGERGISVKRRGDAQWGPAAPDDHRD